MHLPAVLRRRIVYASVAILGFSGLYYATRPATTPVQQQIAKAAAPASTTDNTQEAAAAPGAPAPAGVAAATAKSTVTKVVAKQKVTEYEVRDGDTIGSIAEAYGLKSETILSANDMGEDDLLSIGQKLILPANDGIVHKVVDGDTLWDIADTYSANIDAIVAANTDVDPNALHAGEMLLIPGGKPPIRRMIASSRSGDSGRRPANTRTLDVWPASGLKTDVFGWRIHPVYGTKHFHDGMDLAMGEGTPIAAASGGTVTMAQRYGGYGLTVKVDHGGGIVTLYAHLNQIDVAVGQKVNAGQRIGLSGNTGASTGPHLHFTVLVDGSPVNPEPWLP